jgi:hypothetical protein
MTTLTTKLLLKIPNTAVRSRQLTGAEFLTIKSELDAVFAHLDFLSTYITQHLSFLFSIHLFRSCAAIRSEE